MCKNRGGGEGQVERQGEKRKAGAGTLHQDQNLCMSITFCQNGNKNIKPL